MRNGEEGACLAKAVEEVRAAAALLAKHAQARPAFQPEYRPLQWREPGACFAVDGSHAVLADNGAVWVVATRAAAVAWPGPRPVETPPVVMAALAADAQAGLDAAYAEVIPGVSAPRVRSAEAFAEGLCALAEFATARAAIQAASRDSLVLADGALDGLPPHAQAMTGVLKAEAVRRGVSLVGVSKRSSIGEGMPLVSWLQEHGPAGPWAVEVPGRRGVCVARLHGRARHAFRVDAASLDDIGQLLPLSRDAVYVGYPYPLARAHNAVALTSAHVAELRHRMDTAVRQTSRAAAGLLSDFHDVLDRSVPG